MKKIYTTPEVAELFIAPQNVVMLSAGEHEPWGTSVEGSTEILSDPVDDVMGNILGL